MSAGAFQKAKYEDKFGVIHPISIQPETLSLTLATVANDEPVADTAAGVASVRVSGSRRAIGYNARLIRFRVTGNTLPPGYSQRGILTLPILTKAADDAWGKNSTGTYTLNGTAYPVEYVGKTPETIV